MASIAELRVPAEEFCLEDTVPNTDAVFELVRLVAHDHDRALPFVRASGEEATLAGLDAKLAADRTVDAVECIATVDDGRLYRMAWIDTVGTIVPALLEEEGTILRAVTDDKRWQLRVLFPDRDALSRAYDGCADRDLTVTIDRIYELDDRRHQQLGLTPQQHETLRAALEHGYYDVPREVTLMDLAAELEISHQALSERLRRGHGNLVRNALAGTDEAAVETASPLDRDPSVAGED